MTDAIPLSAQRWFAQSCAFRQGPTEPSSSYPRPKGSLYHAYVKRSVQIRTWRRLCLRHSPPRKSTLTRCGQHLFTSEDSICTGHETHCLLGLIKRLSAGGQTDDRRWENDPCRGNRSKQCMICNGL